MVDKAECLLRIARLRANTRHGDVLRLCDDMVELLNETGLTNGPPMHPSQCPQLAKRRADDMARARRYRWRKGAKLRKQSALLFAAQEREKNGGESA